MKIGAKLGQHLSLTLKVCNWRLAERLNLDSLKIKESDVG